MSLFGRGNNQSKSLILIITILAILNLTKLVNANTALIDSGAGLILWMEILTLSVFGGITGMNFQAHRKMGNSIISLPFVYLYFGILVTISSRVFILLDALGFYNVPSMVVGIYWHLFIYSGIFIFFIAIEKLADRTRDKELSPISTTDYTIIGLFLLVSLVLFLTPSTLGVNLMYTIMRTPIPQWGLLHFLAFFFAALLALRMFQVIQKTRKTRAGRYMYAVSTPFLLFLVITTLNHLTALLTESWNVVTVDSGIISTVEQSFWLIGILTMAYGYYRLETEINLVLGKMREQTDTVVEEPEEQNETVQIVLDKLEEHVGTLAKDIAEQSSQKSGIKLSELSKDNIDEFATEVENNTLDLIGEFPSRYLKVSLQKSVKSN